MDPLTQGLLGATASQNTSQSNHIAIATLLGFLAGMAPDLDILIRSETDPLLFLEYHRQFTHSLIFIPFGGLICGAPLYFVFAKWKGLSLQLSILYCTAGYATHALLDSCTSYGTQLFWPFSNTRIAWNTISIIDPIFTLPILFLVVIAWLAKSKLFARITLIWIVSYFLVGIIQRERAEYIGWQLAQERGHEPLQLHAKPSFANLIVWKVVYETNNKYYIDAVRTGLQTKIYQGQSINKLDLQKDFPWLDPNSQQAKDIERFRWFSNGYIAQHPNHPNSIIDVRYSTLPNSVDALWGISLSEHADSTAHVKYKHSNSNRKDAFQILMNMILDKHPL